MRQRTFMSNLRLPFVSPKAQVYWKKLVLCDVVANRCDFSINSTPVKKLPRFERAHQSKQHAARKAARLSHNREEPCYSTKRVDRCWC
jgi:hypothetical protein